MQVSGKSSVRLEARKSEKTSSRSGSLGNIESDMETARVRDEVSLSPDMELLRKTTELIHSLPDVREEMVAEIKQRVEDGTYRVEEEKLAFKIVKEALFNNPF